MRSSSSTELLVLVAAVLVGLAVLLSSSSRGRIHVPRPAPSERPDVTVGAGGGAAHRPFRRGPSKRSLSDVPPEQVASAMVLLAVALQSGCGVMEALEQVAGVGDDAAGRQLGIVAAALRWGLADHEAWSVVDPAWSRTALALRLAGVSGVAPSSLLLEGADDLRSRELARVDVAAARVGVRLVVPLGVAFLPAFLLTTVVPVVLALTRQVLST
jgi:pilus assembly protein TadC